MLNNDAKSLSFLGKNRLIFAFQTNIIKNKKHSKYFKWFDFAAKTANLDNSEEDFLEYKKDEVMSSVMERIKAGTYKPEDSDYFEEIEDWKSWGLLIGIEEGMEKGIEKGMQKGMEKGMEKGMQLGKEEARAEERKKRRQEALESARILKKHGVSIELIMQVTKLSKATIEKL